MNRYRRFLIWILLLGSLGCFLPVWSQEEALSSQEEEEQKESSALKMDETFGVPIPSVGLDPNEGATLGVLLAVISESGGRLNSIIAPVAENNKLKGTSFDLNYFWFPSENIALELLFSHSTENFWEYRVEYRQEQFLEDYLSLSAFFTFRRNASGRFYGIGQKTDENAETNYTIREVNSNLTLTAELARNVYMGLSIKPRRSYTKGDCRRCREYRNAISDYRRNQRWLFSSHQSYNGIQ